MQYPDQMEWLKLAIVGFSIFLLIAFAELMRSYFKFKPVITRKLVHVFTGLFIFFTPDLFESAIFPALIAIFFVLFNSICIRFGYFQSIHESTHKSYGTIFYPLAFLILILLFWSTNAFIIQVSFLILAFADSLAAIVGQQINKPRIYKFTKETKSLQGSFTFAATTFLILTISFYILPLPLLSQLPFSKILLISFIAAVFTTILEALSWKGSDNLSIPLGAAFFLHFLLVGSPDKIMQLTVGFTLAIFVAVLSLRFKFLDLSGAAGTFVLGTIIFGVGGLVWAIPVLAFFTSSSLLSKLWQNRKKISNLVYEKTSTRDIGQVLANGGVACITVLLYYSTENDVWLVVFLATIAAVTSDTWATEIGGLSRKPPRLITTLKPVAAGTSGAISLMGIFMSLLGGLFIALIGIGLTKAFSAQNIHIISMITISALLASLVDSLLGATLQAQYRCELCNKSTERLNHCNGLPTIHMRGLKWLSNDIVNMICAFSGGVFVFIGLQFI